MYRFQPSVEYEAEERGKWVEIPRGPAAVIEKSCRIATGKPGRRSKMMMLEPEDLSVLLHRELYER